MGGDDWSLAFGLDWVRRDDANAAKFDLREGESVVANTTVVRVPRLRGPVREALDDWGDDLRDELARSGFARESTQPVIVDGAAGAQAVFRPFLAGRVLRAIVRAESRPPAFGVVSCAVAEEVGPVEASCRPILNSYRFLGADEEPQGRDLFGQHRTVVSVDPSWLFMERPRGEPMTAYSARVGQPSRVIVEGGDDATIAAELMNNVERYYRERGGTFSGRSLTRARDARRLDFTVRFTEPLGVTVTTITTMRGRHLYSATCSEESVAHPERARCPALLRSFRFDAP